MSAIAAERQALELASQRRRAETRARKAVAAEAARERQQTVREAAIAARDAEIKARAAICRAVRERAYAEHRLPTTDEYTAALGDEAGIDCEGRKRADRERAGRGRARVTQGAYEGRRAGRAEG